MSIRIIEQSSDQGTQNPPPEEDAFSSGGVRSKEVSAATSAVEITQVFTGSPRANILTDDLGPVMTSESPAMPQQASTSPAESASNESAPQDVSVSTQGTGWSLHDGGGKYQVNDAGADSPITKKFAPRWTLGPATVGQQQTEQIKLQGQSDGTKS